MWHVGCTSVTKRLKFSLALCSPDAYPAATRNSKMTINEQTLQGNWNEFKGKVRETWGDLSNDDLDRARGNLEQLVGIIQQKTGETKEQISQKLEELGAGSQAMLADASEAVRNAAAQVSERVQAASQQAAESMQAASEEAAKQVQAGYIQTKRVVTQRPIESMAVVFGVGLLTGIIAGMISRSR